MARSIPFEWYHSPDIYKLELQRVFAHSWQYAGSADRLPEPGSFFTTWIAQTPVVVVRDTSDELRAFANVCAHRGHLVAEGDGCRPVLQCRYHGWTYNLDGRLRGAPRTAQDPTFVPRSVGLREFAVARWGPLVFVSPEPSVSFMEATEGLRAAAAERGLDLDTRSRSATRAVELACNWKVTLDNNTECYHCATVHRSFASNYYVDRNHYLMRGFERAFTHESSMRDSDNDGSAPDFHLYYLWPNFMLSARRTDYFYTYHYRPTGPNTTLQVNDYFFPAGWSESEVSDTIDDIGVIMQEDQAAFESVQLGMESGALANGIVLPREEQLLCHFQDMLVDALEA